MIIECDKCQYQWETKSKMFIVSCPRCGSKVKINKKESDDGTTGSVESN